MWNNPFQNPIPQSSSSRQVGGITIPPLKFSSPRQPQADQLSAGSSVASAISLDKLKLFYQQKINAMKQDIQAQAIQHIERRKIQMQDILVKSMYSKQQVKQIILKNDKQLIQLLNEFYIQKVSQEEAKLGILETFNQAVSVVDLIQIISDLVKRLSENPIKVDLLTLNRISEEEDEKQNTQFFNQVDILKNQNIIVINKLKRIIQKRRVKTQGERSHFNLQNIPKLQNQRVFPSSNLNETNQVGSILNHIFYEIQQLKNQIKNMNKKIQSHSLTDKTMVTVQKQYGRATQKVNVLENEIQLLNKKLISRSKQNIEMYSHNEQLQMAIQKIQSLEKQIDEATYNFNKQTQQLQYYLDQKDKKIKILTQALNSIELNHQKQTKYYQNNLSNQVDLLLSEIDRLTKQLQKAQLQTQGYQLTIARFNKIIEDKQQQQVQQNAENELIRYIEKQCEEMTNQNQKTIQKLDKQKDLKEQKLKNIYYAVAQKSNRTNQSRQKNYKIEKQDIDIENDLINNLYNKIDYKIEQLKIEKQRSMNLELQNLELKEAILLLKGQFENLQGNFSNRSKPKSRNLIAQMIDSYSIQQKSFMADCFGLLIKILSESVNSEPVLTRCQNLLRCAQTQLQKDDKITFSKTPLSRQHKYEDKSQKVSSIPTLQIPKKLQTGKDLDKTGKIKRRQVG